ncbi:hypothetical protein ABKN59_010198 [Abortiporus biennis]
MAAQPPHATPPLKIKTLDSPNKNAESLYELVFTRQPAVLATPGFPQPLQHPTKKKYNIRAVDGKGLAMFATDDIDVGELIVCERPLVMLQQLVDLPMSFIRNSSKEAIMQAAMKKTERRLESLIAKMHSKFREQYMSLVNSHHHDGSGPLHGRMRTNAFGMRDFYNPEGEKHTCSVVGNEISRVNHSCCPNSNFSFHRPSFAMELRATRYIPKGTEITVNYCGRLEPCKDRQKLIQHYGFTCDCPACKDPISSDNFRDVLVRTVDNMLKNDRTTLEDVLIFITKIEDFGLEGTWYYIRCLLFVEQSYRMKGMKEESKAYRNRVYKHTLALAGRGDVMHAIASF